MANRELKASIGATHARIVEWTPSISFLPYFICSFVPSLFHLFIPSFFILFFPSFFLPSFTPCFLSFLPFFLSHIFQKHGKMCALVCHYLYYKNPYFSFPLAFMYYFDNPGGMIPSWLINWAAKVCDTPYNDYRIPSPPTQHKKDNTAASLLWVWPAARVPLTPIS